MIWYGVVALGVCGLYLLVDHLLWLRWRRRWLRKSADRIAAVLDEGPTEAWTGAPGITNRVTIDYGDTP